MNIHEYQAKEILKRYAIPVHSGTIAKTPEEAFQLTESLVRDGASLFAVKAQIHAGARGKGGGIAIVKTPEEAKKTAAKLIGKNLVTPQTGAEGKPVDCVLIESTSPLKKEYYASVVLDRSAEKPCLIASEAGGMEIEEVAMKEPEKIIKKHFSAWKGLGSEEAHEVAACLSKEPGKIETFKKIFQAMGKLFLELDASLVEINPLAVLESGEIIAIDAKINFDDNGLYRHPEIAALYDPRQEDPREVEAKKLDLSYVGLDGNIGCIVNGAGLAMATMDIIKYAGGEPANFLDVGGGATKEKVTEAFKIVLTDPDVKALLVNIFGGIMRCDVVAEGILAAVKELKASPDSFSLVPIVVRLEGTNVKEGKALLENSSLNLIIASSFEEAAEKAVEAASR
ncbi:MAG TPA: ADP-forming succinate--CoA ligase subunit beta [bacterium]|nr:ADP-forming succinate--CoA ligase subunit beta [bacterium]